MTYPRIWTLVFQRFVSYLNSINGGADVKTHYPNVLGVNSVTCSLWSDIACFPDNTVSELCSEQPNHTVYLCNVAAPQKLVYLSIHLTYQKCRDAPIAFILSPYTCPFVDMQWPQMSCVCVFVCVLFLFFLNVRTGKRLQDPWILMCCQLDFSQLIMGCHSESDSHSYVLFVLIFQLRLIMLASHLLLLSLSPICAL